jgi:hypothetical protein
VVVVEHEHDRLRQRRQLIDQHRQHDLHERGAVDGRAASADRPTPGATVPSAAQT